MPATKPSDPTRRIKTRHRGISYRVRAGGERTYSVYFGGRYIAVDGGEQEAIAKQADLRGKAARGEKPVAPTKATFREIADAYFESKPHPALRRPEDRGTQRGARRPADP